MQEPSVAFPSPNCLLLKNTNAIEYRSLSLFHTFQISEVAQLSIRVNSCSFKLDYIYKYVLAHNQSRNLSKQCSVRISTLCEAVWTTFHQFTPRTQLCWHSKFHQISNFRLNVVLGVPKTQAWSLSTLVSFIIMILHNPASHNIS